MEGGWVQKISRRKKIPYYFNTITGKTQWTEPSNTEKARGKKRARSNSSDEQNKGSSKEKAKGSTLSSTKSKSSSVKDRSPASKPLPAKKSTGTSNLETKLKSGKQEEFVTEYVPRILLPRKRSKRKKTSSTTSEEPKNKSQEVKQLLPWDKADHSKGPPPAKCTRTVSKLKIERKEIIRAVGTNQETPSPKGKGLQKKEYGGTPLRKERTAVESVSLMEVDLPLSTEGKVLVVVDTNVLINSLYYLRFLKGRTIEDLGDVMVTIPWIVMQELDLLKGPNCMAMTPLSASARKALNFLHTNRTDPDIKGQSYNNFVKTVKEKDVQGTSDDKILHYCLQCKNKYLRNLVVLLSNDKNLCVKASFSGVPSSGDNGFIEEIKKQVRSHAQLSFSSDDNDVFSPGNEPPSSGRGSPDGTITCLSPMECQPSGLFRNTNNDRRKPSSSTVQPFEAKRNTPSPPVQQSNARTNVHHQVVEKEMKKEGRPSTSVASCSTNEGKTDLKEKKPAPQVPDPAAERKKKEREYTNQMLSFLRLALVIVLRHEMIDCYTDHWLEIVHKKPPWSLLDALQCIKKHYIAVFSLLLGRHNADEVDQLISIVGKIREDDYFTSKQLNSFHFASLAIFMPLNKNAKYKDITTKCEDDMKRIYNQWKEILPRAPKPKTDVVIISQAPKSPPVSSFLHSITDSEPPRAEESVQESEDMCISPPATSSSNTLEVDVDRGTLINNQEARQDERGERREGDGMDSVTYIVLSVFGAIWIVLKYHRDVIVWSFKHLASGCPIEGLPTKDESLNYLSLALPLIEAIVQALQRLIGSCIPVPVVCCAEVIESLQAYIQALKLDLDMSGFHPEMFLHFLSTEDNRERLVVGSQQLTEVLQHLHECRVTLCQF